MTLLNFINSLFQVTLELDGNIDKLNTETVQYQYALEKCAERSMRVSTTIKHVMAHWL